MSAGIENTQNTGGLCPEYKSYERQKCFVGHSTEAAWRDDLLSACAEILPKFDLEPWYAADHFDPTKPLREKVVQLIANARYGIYDLSSWQDKSGKWHLSRNVFIELGMAITLNRPVLLLRHTSNKALPLPDCFQGLNLIEFTGDHTLKKALKENLPQWLNVLPDRDWLNRFCIFGNRICSFREEHPRTRQWSHQILCCHLTDGLDKHHPDFQIAEREEIRGAFEDVFSRYNDLEFTHLDELSITDGYQFLLCSHCQTVRSAPFAIYRLSPHTPVEVFIAIGMSIALEILFEYDIPKIILIRNEQELPSLLRGYEVVEAGSSSNTKKKLMAFIPSIIQEVRKVTWKPRPLPFVEIITSKLELASKGFSEDLEIIRDVVPFQVPSLPFHFIGRAHAFQYLKSRLTEANNPFTLMSVQGIAGVGKTTLVAALAQDPDIRASFSDGVLWVSLGSQPDILPVLASWIQALGTYDFHPTNVEEASTHLRSLLNNKTCLLVIDDVWEIDQLRPFLVGGPSCQELITTRNVNLVREVGAQVYNYNLDVMTDEEALTFIIRNIQERGGRELQDDELPKAKQLIHKCGGLPLALEWAMAQMVAMALNWDELLVRLDRYDLDSNNFEAFDTTLDLSYAALAPDEQKFFRAISIFVEDPIFSIKEAAILGEYDEVTTEEFLRRLMELSLVERSQLATDAYKMYPLVRSYAFQKLEEANESDLVKTRHGEALRSSLLPLLVNFEGVLRDLVDRALQFRYGYEWSTQLNVDQDLSRLSLGRLLNLVRDHRSAFEPLFATPETYSTLVTSAKQITTTRNAVLHTAPGIDITEMQQVKNLVEKLLPAIREAQAISMGASQSRIDLSEKDKERCQTVIDNLTPRELETLKAFATGLSPQEVANEMEITINTVNAYSKKIFELCRMVWPDPTAVAEHHIRELFGPYFKQGPKKTVAQSHNEGKDSILVVEDDADISKMLQIYFESQGFEVLVAFHGEEALEICQNHVPNVIVLDYRLPDIDGAEVYRRLQSSGPTRNIPTVFLTLSEILSDNLNIHESSLVDFLAKPFVVDDLKLRVEHLVARSRKNRTE